MPKELFPIRSGGFSLIEVLISSGLILVLATMFTAAVLNAQEDAVVGGMRARASLMAEGALEVARNIRDRDFDALVVGTHGIDLNNDAWSLEFSSVTLGIFTITLTIQAVDAVTKQVTSTVTWPQTGSRTGTLSMVSYLSDLRVLRAPAGGQAGALVPNTTSAFVGGSSARELRGITIQNSGATPIVLTKIKTSWSPRVSSLLQNITIGGTTVWSSSGPGSPTGSQSPGATTTIQSVTIAGGATLAIDRFLFTQNMHGNSFDIVFTMQDGTQKIVTTPVLP